MSLPFLGSVIRLSPNELSFSSVESWKDIYGSSPGKHISPKSGFYDIYGAGFASTCIGSERDPAVHQKVKRSLAAAFTNKALGDQESIIHDSIDRFLERVENLSSASGGINLTEWYGMVAFDLLGEMAFGESFGSIQDGK